MPAKMETKTTHKCAAITGFLAVGIFILFAVLIWVTAPISMMWIHGPPPFLMVFIAQILFSLVILAFLGGAHWAQGMRDDNPHQVIFGVWPVCVSGVIALILSVLLGHLLLPYLLIVGIYVGMYNQEFQKYRLDLPDVAKIWRKRVYVTAAVTLFLSSAGYVLILALA